jgi:hypothetical protein
MRIVAKPTKRLSEGLLDGDLPLQIKKKKNGARTVKLDQITFETGPNTRLRFWYKGSAFIEMEVPSFSMGDSLSLTDIDLRMGIDIT